MASLEIQKFESIEVDYDINVEGAITCANHVFIGRLCVTDLHGFKVYKLKDNKVPEVLRLMDPNEEKFNHNDHGSCADWYRRAVHEGYCQYVAQLFLGGLNINRIR